MNAIKKEIARLKIWGMRLRFLRIKINKKEGMPLTPHITISRAKHPAAVYAIVGCNQD
jgi:hypothetical protein